MGQLQGKDVTAMREQSAQVWQALDVEPRGLAAAARRLGCSISTLHHLRRGDTLPSLPLLRRLCAACSFAVVIDEYGLRIVRQK